MYFIIKRHKLWNLYKYVIRQDNTDKFLAESSYYFITYSKALEEAKKKLKKRFGL